MFFEKVINIGINKFDTPPRYGRSEELMGRYLSKKNTYVSSKIDNLSVNDFNSPKKMIDSVKNSLKRMNKDFLDICYLHQNEIEILSDPYIQEGIKELKSLNLIKKSGASVYTLEECDYCVNNDSYDCIQIPINIADTSFYARFVKNQKINKIFVGRSILLQGALIESNRKKKLFRYSNELNNYLNKINYLYKKTGLSNIEFYLSFVFGLKEIDHFIIGSTSIENIKNNIKCAEIKLDPQLINQLVDHGKELKKWTNPRNWN